MAMTSMPPRPHIPHLFLIQNLKEWMEDDSLFYYLHRFVKKEGTTVFILMQPCGKPEGKEYPIPILSLPRDSLVDMSPFFLTEIKTEEKKMTISLQRVRGKTPTIMMNDLRTLGALKKGVHVMQKNLFFFGGIILQEGDIWEQKSISRPFYFKSGRKGRPEGIPEMFESNERIVEENDENGRIRERKKDEDERDDEWKKGEENVDVGNENLWNADVYFLRECFGE